MNGKKFTLILEPISSDLYQNGVGGDVNKGASTGGTSVFYKEDGVRFANTHTLKLRQGADYNFRITLQPPLSLESIKVQLDEEVTTSEKECVAVCGVREESRDQQKAVYLASWTPDPASPLLMPTAKNSRQPLFLFFPMNLGEVCLKLQCKVYKEKHKSACQGGKRLLHIEQTFTINEHSTLELLAPYSIK